MRLPLLWMLILMMASLPARAAEDQGNKLVVKDAASELNEEVELYHKTYAVIIGIDRYLNLPLDRQLQNAVKDARGMEEVLRSKYRFDRIVTLENQEATKERIMHLLTSELPKEMGKDDALFLFWAGHGNQEKSNFGDLGYLVPYDGSTEEIYRNITMAEIRDTISKKIPAKHVFYVMDACYSGLLTTRSVDNKPRRDLAYLKEISKESVRQVLTAGGKDEEALDGGPMGHSVFTGRLIELLQNATDFITANELQASIRERVYSDASARNHTQTPSFGVLYGLGDFIFIPKADKSGEINPDVLARQKELEKLKKAEADAARAKEQEKAEIAKKEADIDTLDRQILEMKRRLGAGAAQHGDSLDSILALAQQKEDQGKKLEELKRQQEEEECKRKQVIAGLRKEANLKRKDQVMTDLHKFKKVSQFMYAQDMVASAWDALVATYPEAKGVPQGDLDKFLEALGYSIGPFSEPLTGMEFVPVKGGCFKMGDTIGDGRKNEQPVHEVCVSDFYMGKYDVTVDQFRKFVVETGYLTDAERNEGGAKGCVTIEFGKEPEWDWRGWASWKNPNKYQEKEDLHPVSCVSWNDTQAFISWINKKTFSRFRLPTEAEWEYAARAGTKGRNFWGDAKEDACIYANVADQSKLEGDLNWTAKHECSDGYPYASPVGNFKSNGFGLYDMVGNVWAWVSDWYADDYYAHSLRNDPPGPVSASYHAYRGAGWVGDTATVRIASRYGDKPTHRCSTLGFRLAAPFQ